MTSLEDPIREKLDQLVQSHSVLLFMKGNRQAPQCGFSARVISILDNYLDDYATVDVLSDGEVREGIKLYSSWPTIPQLYVNGEFIGGCDIITEMADGGELFGTFGVERTPSIVPEIHIGDDTAEALLQASAQNGGPDQYLHLSVSKDWQTSLSVAARSAMDVEVQSNGVTLMVDPFSTDRANGITIELVETAEGRGFKVDNPNAPTLGEMSVQELKTLLESGDDFEFIDVRTPSEFETARIDGAVLFDETEYARLSALPKQTKIVFICHHGPRGVNAGQQFTDQGFTNLHNVTGGIDAWSLTVDPEIPRY
ncbi:MAG: Grx4 family monothiol glutaredoxin [Myxococcota bacterium]|nr:Grx4 family monothiol glutaredoxin [Myxococcota bacterium]